jgi:hypothetical protein
MNPAKEGMTFVSPWPCGCMTWKHERNWWLCWALTDQEIGEAVERGDDYICQYYE